MQARADRLIQAEVELVALGPRVEHPKPDPPTWFQDCRRSGSVADIQSDIAVERRLVGEQILRLGPVNNLTAFEDDGFVCHFEGRFGMLLDKDDRHAGFADHSADCRGKFLDDDRRETLKRLVASSFVHSSCCR